MLAANNPNDNILKQFQYEAVNDLLCNAATAHTAANAANKYVRSSIQTTNHSSVLI